MKKSENPAEKKETYSRENDRNRHLSLFLFPCRNLGCGDLCHCRRLGIDLFLDFSMSQGRLEDHSRSPMVRGKSHAEEEEGAEVHSCLFLCPSRGRSLSRGRCDLLFRDLSRDKKRTLCSNAS